MKKQRQEQESADVGAGSSSHGAPGKRARTDSLARSARPQAAAISTGSSSATDVQSDAHEDPFAMHLIGSSVPDARTGEEGPQDTAAHEAHADTTDAGAADAPAGEETATEHRGDDGENAGTEYEKPAAIEGAPGEDAAAADGVPSATESASAEEPSGAHPHSGDVSSPDSALAGGTQDDASPIPSNSDSDGNVAGIAATQAGLIQSAAASESIAAVTAISQREQVLRGTFTQQRAAIRTVAETQAALARSDAKAAAERVRGRNGLASKTIAEMTAAEVARLSHGVQDAMARVSTASRAVTPAIRDAANNALPNANLDLRDANEGQLANELYQRLVPKAQTAARQEAHAARDRDIDRLASTRDANIRQMKKGGDLLARQATNELAPVERAILDGGEKIAALIEGNARSQALAIDAAERDASMFFARARAQAQQLVGAGRATAGALLRAAAGANGAAGAAARFQGAAAHVAPQLASRRERLVSSVDAVVQKATTAVAHATTEFQAECTAHRAIASGNHAAIEGTLAANIAGKLGQIRAEWGKEIDVAIISANSFAAVVEAGRAQLIAMLPTKFGGIVRSAFSEARKSRLRRFGEGVWGAVSGLVTTLAKFVAAALIIAFAPFAFGIAALIGKAGVLAGIVRDAAMAVVGMAQAFAERFRVLFRTWDDWPWYGKVAGLWATTLVAVGDMVGLPSIFESVTGKELISNRELSYDERGAKTFGGGVAAITTLLPAKAYADKGARAAAAREMGKDLGELEAQAAAKRAESASAATPESATAEASAAKALDEAADQRIILQGTDTEIAELAQKIAPEPGTVDVYVHGSIDDVIVHHNGAQVHLDAKRLANYIRSSGKQVQRVRLISCSTGAHPKGFAQHLSNQLGVTVVAPSDILYINRKTGAMTIGPSPKKTNGTWIEFEPKASERRYTPWKEKPSTETRHERFLRERAEKAQGGSVTDHATPSPEPRAPQPVEAGDVKTLGRRDRSSLFDDYGDKATYTDDAAEWRGEDLAGETTLPPGLQDDALSPRSERAPRTQDPNRPTWRESELQVTDDLKGGDFEDQTSFQYGERAPHGAPGSVRPDNYSAKNKISVDVKNYDVTTADGRGYLVDNVVNQAKERAVHLPPGTRQSVVIDARGQVVSARVLESLRKQILASAEGLILSPDDIVIFN